MAKAPRVIRNDLVKDLLARQAFGYSVSGTSQHTRNSAHGIRPSGRADGRPERSAPKDLHQFLARTIKQIAKLRCDISLETNNSKRHGKLQHDLDIKVQLADRLENEIAESANAEWDWKTVTDLPGDSEADWL
jgi:hypothetical protein